MNQSDAEQKIQDTVTNNNLIKRILYATDLTETSPRVYQYVLRLAKQFNAEIVSLHVIDNYSQNAGMKHALSYFTKEMKREIVARETREAIEEMEQRNRQSFIRQQLGIEDGLCPEQLGLQIVNKVVFGTVEEQILLQSINQGCDLIVMGAHEKPFYNFTTTLSKRVMKRSTVPVTVVPIPGDRKERSPGLLPVFSPHASTAR